MRRGQKTDPKSFDLTTPCPSCGYRVPPSEMVRLDFELMRCPMCGKDVRVATNSHVKNHTAKRTRLKHFL